ncbi:hypothetical protein [Clostridium aciditolerans]|uniref:Uncharacterized protein n=1 Tax=Clostridium aciditolerans TaxID=339861 RepID=A0A934HVY9_9CLOT|nr:hypothetical protein [Clostridium aciditolerans]MBI6875616.1 hypothetical protein [Clostridium aciditolerans]
MEYLIKLKKDIVFIISLFESWISYYHKKRIIKYVALANMLFIILLDLIVMIATYSILYITNKQLFMSKLQLFMFYMTVLFAITFQNIFDADFNIASKIKVLLFSVFEGLTIKQVFTNIGTYCGISFGLFIWLYISIHNYIKAFNINKISKESMLQLIVIIVLILTFIIYVYGINNSDTKNKRKLVLYGISALVTFISTINNITEILDFKFVGSIIGVILSIDRFANAYGALMKNYYEKNRCLNETMKELCEEKNLTFENIDSFIKNRFSKFIKSIKDLYYIFKSLENKKKFKVILYIIFSPVIVIVLIGIGANIAIFGMNFIEKFFHYMFYKLNYATYGVEGVLWGILRAILKLVGIVLYIIVLVICILYILDTILNIRNKLKNKKKFKELQKKIEILIVSIFIFDFIMIIPFSIFDIRNNNVISYVFKAIMYIDLCILMLYIISIIINWIINVIYNVINKIKKKLKQYKKDK